MGPVLCAMCCLIVVTPTMPVYSTNRIGERYEVKTQKGLLFAVERGADVYTADGRVFEVEAVAVVNGTAVCMRHVLDAGQVSRGGLV